jgi:hypothetical protein
MGTTKTHGNKFYNQSREINSGNVYYHTLEKVLLSSFISGV